MGQFGVMIGQLVGFLHHADGRVRMREASLLRPDRARRHVLAAAQRAHPRCWCSRTPSAGADRAQLAANWGAMLLTAVMYALLILVFRLGRVGCCGLRDHVATCSRRH